jgi:hypothetical protein
MTTMAERIGALELRVNGLETWAGPGQASVLAAGLQAVRGDLAILRRTQEGMLRTQEGMLGDLAALRGTQESMLRTQEGILGDLAALRGTQESMLRTQEGILGDLAALRGTQEEHTRALASLTADVETLKADMCDVKETLREVLRRLPPPALAG